MPISLSNSNWLIWNDGYLVDTTSNIAYVGWPGSKRGPVLAPARLWEQGRVGPTGTVVTHSDTVGGESFSYRMFYGITPEILSPARRILAYAVSGNGRHWARPELDLYTFRGHTANNITNATGNKWALSDVLRDTRAGVPSNLVYKSLSAAPLTGDANGFRLQTSSNGRSWTNNGTDALTDIIADGQPQLFYDSPQSDNYRVFMRGWTNTGSESTTKRGVSTFVVGYADILNSWNAYKPSTWYRSAWSENVFLADQAVMAIPANPYDIYFAGVSQIDNGYIAFPSMYSREDFGGDGRMRLAAALSRAGAAFTFADGDGITSPVVSYGTNREVDSGTLYAFSGLIQIADRHLMFYGADNTKHNGGTLPPGQTYRSAICCAEWRRDGWVSAQFGTTTGEILTKQITFLGSSLSIQADAAHGQLKAALCDSGGTALSGFGFDNCTAIAADGQHTVIWTGGSIAAYANQTVRLRFQGTRADLYSLRFA